MQADARDYPGTGVSGDGTRVLIIEDDAPLAEMLVDILREEGYAADAVSDGMAGLRYLRTHPAPGLILLDLLTPGMDGFEFRRVQRSRPEFAAIPVAVISAVASWFKAENRMEAAVYLDKPLDMRRVLAAVEHHCGEPNAGLERTTAA